MADLAVRVEGNPVNGHEASDVEIADAWIDHTYRYRPAGERSAAHDDDPAWWAIDVVMDLQSSDPMRALEIAFAIARKSTDEWVLENLGAGPLETLLRDDPTLLDAIQIEAASSAGLLEALRSVWSSSMPDETRAALHRLIGP
ncbi:DUF6869 domain-containing protein [Phenylobacterium sp.]|uniref:DUF6869 domain-containing protein n=1 Tax=Phenylobacterium sp. TaxID=1871053 RepID=UPI00261D6162|nr:hypothetical protein [Phenylobacterium sp.]